MFICAQMCASLSDLFVHCMQMKTTIISRENHHHHFQNFPRIFSVLLRKAPIKILVNICTPKYTKK